MKLSELFYKETRTNNSVRIRLFGISVFKLFINPHIIVIKILNFKITKHFKFETVFNKAIEEEFDKNSDIKSKVIYICGEILMKSNKALKNNSKIAVFTGGEMAISEYTVKTHAKENDKFDIISGVETLEQLERMVNLSSGNIIPYITYKKHQNEFNHCAKIFVLGNSGHHQNAMEEAVATKGEKNRFLYLHEAQMYGAVHTFFNFHCNYKNPLLKWYSSKHLETVYWIRPLIELTGINHIFVNNEKAKELILLDVTEKQRKDLKIDIMFLPIEDLSSIKPIKIKKSDEYIVGSFGIPQKEKNTDKIIDAIYHLIRQGYNIKLLLAGYYVNNYLEELDENKKSFILAYEQPPHNELFSLMKSVDLAVQLRPKPHGENSACVSELLGMGQKIITTKGFMSEIVKDYCYFVDPNISTEALANIIIEKLKETSSTNSFDLIKTYSLENLSQKVYEKVKETVL